MKKIIIEKQMNIKDDKITIEGFTIDIPQYNPPDKYSKILVTITSDNKIKIILE